MKLDLLLNRRVIFKLHGINPLDSTILRQDETGYWIRGGTLAPQLDQSNARSRTTTCVTSSSPASNGCERPATARHNIDNRQFNSDPNSRHDFADIVSTTRCTPLPIPRAAASSELLSNAARLPRALPQWQKHAGLCAGDIEERVRLTQPTISHHMAILTESVCRRE